jgi:predicted RecB family nuclease
MDSPPPDPEDVEVDLSDHLKVDEDDKLRVLNYLWMKGLLSEHSKERLVELRLRDRRQKVRELRNLGEEEPPEDLSDPL